MRSVQVGFGKQARTKILARSLHPDEEGNTDHGTFPGVCEELEGKLLGKPERKSPSGNAAVAGSGIAAAAGPVLAP